MDAKVLSWVHKGSPCKRGNGGHMLTHCATVRVSPRPAGTGQTGAGPPLSTTHPHTTTRKPCIRALPQTLHGPLYQAFPQLLGCTAHDTRLPSPCVLSSSLWAQVLSDWHASRGQRLRSSSRLSPTLRHTLGLARGRHTCTYAHTRAHTCTHTCVHTRTRTRARAHTCTHVYTHTHTRAHTLLTRGRGK